MADGASAGRRTRDLDRDTCLAVLRSGEIARLVYFEAALPAVEPLRYRFVDDEIVFAVPHGCGLATASEGSVLAAQVDDLDHHGDGLSVLVTAQAREITPPGATQRMLGLPLQRLSGHRVSLVRESAEPV